MSQASLLRSYSTLAHGQRARNMTQPVSIAMGRTYLVPQTLHQMTFWLQNAATFPRV